MKILDVSSEHKVSEEEMEILRKIYVNRKDSIESYYETYENQFLDDIGSSMISIGE